MSNHIEPDTIPIALARIGSTIQSMLLDIEELSASEESTKNVLRYMIHCYDHPIHTVVVGECPYPGHIIPYMGSAYSQLEGTDDTPSTEVICKHFRQHPGMRNMIRDSWKLLPLGYMFINAYYSPKPRNDVLLIERLEYVIEYLCDVCAHRLSLDSSIKFTLVSIGSTAKYSVSEVSTRMRKQRVSHRKVHIIQPAALHKYMHLTDKIGIHDDYQCFTPSGIQLFEDMLQGYADRKNTEEDNFTMASTSGVSQMLSSAVKGISLSNEAVAKMLASARDEPDLGSKINTVISANQKTNTIMQELLTLLHSNAFLTSVIMDNVVPNASQTTAMNTTRVVPMTISNPTSAGIMTGTTVQSMAGELDVSSQMTISVDDVFSPIKMPSVKNASTGKASIQNTPTAAKAKSLNTNVDPKQLFVPPNVVQVATDIDLLAGIRES